MRTRGISPSVARTPSASLAGLVVLSAIYVLARGRVEIQDALYSAIGILAVIALAVDAQRHDDRTERRAWTCIAAGLGGFVVGDLLYIVEPLVTGRETAFPSVPDVPYLAAYAFLGAGMLLHARRRGSGTVLGDALDAGVLAAVLGALLWGTVVAPTWEAGTAPLVAVVAAAYPLLDLCLLGAVVYSLLKGRRSDLGLAVAAALTLGGDLAYAVQEPNGLYAAGGLVDTLFLLSYVCFLGAAVEAEEREVAVATTPSPMTGARVLVLSAAVTTVPLFELVIPDRWQAQVITASLTVAVLVSARLAHLLTTVRRQHHVLDRQAARTRSILARANDPYVECDADGTVLEWNARAREVFGWSAGEARGRTLADLVVLADARPAFTALLTTALGEAGPTGSRAVEVLLRTRDGRRVPAEVTVWATVATDGTPRYHGFLRDVSERHASEAQLRTQALHDPLTGLPNRALLADRLEVGLAAARRDGGRLALLFVDLDDFKVVNDGLGHAAGDELLVRVSARLAGLVREVDTVARLGGDEFAIVLAGVDDEREAAAIAERVLTQVALPVDVGGRTVSVGASVGVAMGDPDDTPDGLVQRADLAMYAAKHDAKGHHRFFERDMEHAALRRLELEGEMLAGIERDEFVIHYQPIVSVATEAVTSVEALVRWQHPSRGLVPPDEFIAAAEANGVIVPLGRHVLRRATAQLAAWQRRRPDLADLRMHVNVSAVQLADADFGDDVLAALRDHAVEPRCLVLELTETMLVELSDAQAAGLHALADRGVRFAIDDFGAGYSSLRYLRRFPVAELKIDRAFISRIAGGPEDDALARAILRLGQSLGIAVTAEGVETVEQAALLRRWRCDTSQGYLYSRPLPGDAVEPLLGIAAEPAA